jgi:hypothetical protein
MCLARPVELMESLERRGAPLAGHVFGISARAREYALGELVRRTAPSDGFLTSLRIDVRSDETHLYLPARGRVVFPHAPNEHFRALAERRITGRTVRATTGRAESTLPDDVVVPFLPADTANGAPLFRIEGDTARCSLDLVASSLLTLSRFEELLPGVRDAWGRFPAAASALANAGALERPVVDEYATALRRLLSELAPSWEPRRWLGRLHLSHDIDEVGVPFRPRHALGHALKRHSVTGALRDLASCVSRTAPAFLAAIRTLVRAGADRGLRAAAYFKRSARTPFDSGYDPNHARVRKVIEWLREMRVELGVHPSHFTLGDPARLAEEVSALRAVLGPGVVGGRQHHLRWSPQSWLDWENAGLSYDASVGFADAPGFRAGTSFPYRPYLLWLDREAKLLELPLIVMDTTLLRYQRLDANDVKGTVTRLLGRVERAGGVFSLLWHNTSIVDRRGERLFDEVLDRLRHLGPYSATEAAT